MNDSTPASSDTVAPEQLGAEAVAVLRMILDHELRSRPSVRCLVATSGDAAVRPSPHGEGSVPAPGPRLRRN